jgi:molybdate transport system substrate-binding protein
MPFCRIVVMRRSITRAALVQFASMSGPATRRMRGPRHVALFLAVAAAAATRLSGADATVLRTTPSGELKVLTTRAISTVLEKLRDEVELRIGRKLTVTTDLAIRLVRRVETGERFDLLIAAPGQIDDLIAVGTIVRETRTDIARSGIGVAVREGAAKPDVSSLEAFTRAILNAHSIAYLKEGQSGLYIAGVLKRLGIAGQIEAKLTLPDTDIVSQLVSRGDVELGIVVITQILTTDGVSLAGPLPPAVQTYVTFTGGVGVNAEAPESATELLQMLREPAAITVMRSQGLEPGRALR